MAEDTIELPLFGSHSVTVNSLEREISKISLNFGWVWYVHFCTNTLQKGITPPLLTLAIG